MNLRRLCLVLCATGVSGCATPLPVDLPPEARGVVVTPVSSASVAVRPPLLRTREGRLELLGFVTKVYGSGTTEGTHLDVAFLDASGRILQRQPAQFYPGRLARDRHAPNRQATYSVQIDALPPGTTSIEVRAHDAPAHQS
jgi:hypothetical protein